MKEYKSYSNLLFYKRKYFVEPYWSYVMLAMNLTGCELERKVTILSLAFSIAMELSLLETINHEE